MQLDKQERQQKLEETFQGVKNPKAEVERGFRFWDVVSAVFALSLLFLRWIRMLTGVLSPFHSVTLGSVPVRCASASASAPAPACASAPGDVESNRIESDDGPVRDLRAVCVCVHVCVCVCLRLFPLHR